jgi:hypothetical protein
MSGADPQPKFTWHEPNPKRVVPGSGLKSLIQKRFLEANKPDVADAMASRTDPIATLPLRAVPKKKTK